MLKFTFFCSIHAKAEPIDVADDDCLSDDEIQYVIEEFQKGTSGDNDSEQGYVSDEQPDGEISDDGGQVE